MKAPVLAHSSSKNVTNKQTDGYMDGWTGEQMDGQTDAQANGANSAVLLLMLCQILGDAWD